MPTASSQSVQSCRGDDSRGTPESVCGIRRSHTITALPRRYETPSRFSKPGNPIDGTELSDERDIYEYFQQFIKQYNPSDVLVYGRTRREAVQQYGHLRHFWLIELWMNVGYRCLLKTNTYASPEARSLADKPGAHLMHITGLNSNQNAWIIASDYPTATVHAYRNKNLWPRHVQHPQQFSGPENFTCMERESYLPFPHADNTFDVINSRSLGYLIAPEDLDTLFAELYRITKPGGAVELFSRLRDLSTLHCFGLSTEDFVEYEAKWKAAVRRSPFQSVKRARIALPQCWGSDICYVSELILLYYRILNMQLRQTPPGSCPDTVLEELVKLEKPTENITEPVTVDLYILQKL